MSILTIEEIRRMENELEEMRKKFARSEHAITASWVANQGARELDRLETDVIKETTKDVVRKSRSRECSTTRDDAQLIAPKKLDLRPVDMIPGSSEQPHVNAIVQPRSRQVSLNSITAEMLSSRRRSLRSVASRASQFGDDEIDVDIPERKENVNHIKHSSMSSTGSIVSIPNRQTFQAPPPPPPPPPPLPAHKEDAAISASDELLIIPKTGTIKPGKPRDLVTNDIPIQSEADLIRPDDSISNIRHGSNEMKSRPVRGRQMNNVQSDSKLSDVLESKNEVTNQRNKRSRSRRSSSRSVVSFLSRSRSNSRSRDESNSEKFDEDEFNIDEGVDNKIKDICERFTIEGPFQDDELNVLHNLCCEYTCIANLTLSRKGTFSRTRPHYERVYLYLSSSRRSKWYDVKRPIIPSGESRLLDFVFRRVLRSQSLVIRRPPMQLDGLDKNKVLSHTRFERIIKHAFNKRKALIEAAVGDLTDFHHLI